MEDSERETARMGRAIGGDAGRQTAQTTIDAANAIDRFPGLGMERDYAGMVLAATPKLYALQTVIAALEYGCTPGDIREAVSAVTDYLSKDQGGR